MKHTHDVWWARVSHRHGTNVYLGASEEEIMTELQAYVDENLDDYIKSTGENPPDDHVDIKDYFEAVEDEFFEVGHQEVTFREGNEDEQEALIENLIRGVMENYPEYSSPSIQCIRWRYDECVFDFIDDEDEKHTVTCKDLRKGFDILMKLAANKEFDVPGWNIDPLHSLDPGVWDDWACDWDADVLDGLVQCAIYGDVIYG